MIGISISDGVDDQLFDSRILALFRRTHQDAVKRCLAFHNKVQRLLSIIGHRDQTSRLYQLAFQKLLIDNIVFREQNAQFWFFGCRFCFCGRACGRRKG